MKIYFDNVQFDNPTGPNTFAKRLAHQFVLMGHIIADYDNYDIQLSFIQNSKCPIVGRPMVQRLDGIWFKPENFHMNNLPIESTWRSASAVIWQSDFDKKMTTHYWGEKKGVVIHNGIDLTRKIVEHHVPALAQLRQKYDHVFSCSSNWHPQKRLNSNIELFQRAREQLPGTSCLIVMGKISDKMLADHDIFYTGSVPEEVYLEVYSMSDWMIHLAWLDHCPNVVIECLSQGTPVICASSGGTNELVGEFGIVLQEETQYKFELADYDNPPQIDITQFDITKLLMKPIEKHADVDIISCAKKYVTLFDELLGTTHE